MKPTRRDILATAAGAVVGGGLVGAAGLGLYAHRRRQVFEPVRALREQFAYLRVGDDVFPRFVDDYVRVYGPVEAEHMDAVGIKFLLSTDFFIKGADESLPVNYLTLYAPYYTPCFNPLAAGG